MTFRFWCAPCGCHHGYELYEAPGQCPQEAKKVSQTNWWCAACKTTHPFPECPHGGRISREKAIAIVGGWPGPVTPGAFVDALAALGILKLEERSPKQTIKDTLAAVRLQPNRNAAAHMGGWLVGPYGAEQILEALDEADFYVGKQEKIWPPR